MNKMGQMPMRNERQSSAVPVVQLAPEDVPVLDRLAVRVVRVVPVVATVDEHDAVPRHRLADLLPERVPADREVRPRVDDEIELLVLQL
eukprot:CAMPEP_0174836298 /NCGR_PEP_ID=MMETSP1114-20130205/5974_1 /TAXON_ID=312471 /ORGANISM="Neobodo designis, Strain CCAP 1951/1" /LENGTH=88 /DNA_ID=CAMNT_0016070281 /DNA_START=18 /DNA_END=281 /DNA_ORIENTATION=-